MIDTRDALDVGAARPAVESRLRESYVDSWQAAAST